MKILKLIVKYGSDGNPTGVYPDEQIVEKEDFMQECYKVIKSNMAQVVQFQFHDVLLSVWMDEEAKLGTPPKHGFIFKDQRNNQLEILGDVVITGIANADGATQSTPITLGELRQLLKPRPIDTQFIVPIQVKPQTVH